MIYPAYLDTDFNYQDFYDSGYYLNYTKFKELTDDQYYVAPRVSINYLYAYRIDDESQI